MKILYSVQATGNGHIARATELLPFLEQYGEVDIFLSGSNSSLNIDLPVKYRSKGVSLFYGNTGRLDYWKMIKAFSPARVISEARSLPVEKYDIVLNDFESITSLACKLKKVPFVHFGHQASFASANTPRPKRKDIAGEFILKHYANSAHKIGLHFEQYDKDIYAPILKSAVLNATPEDHGHVTVYLSHYSDEVITEQLKKLGDMNFHVFSKKVKAITADGNVTLIPVSNKAFTKSMITASGIITGAGFETPAEALYLGKKLLCLPILGQYEQLCNAAALEKFNVTIIEKITSMFSFQVRMWLNGLQPKKLELLHSTNDIVKTVITKGLEIRKTPAHSSEKELFPSNNPFPLSGYPV